MHLESKAVRQRHSRLSQALSIQGSCYVEKQNYIDDVQMCLKAFFLPLLYSSLPSPSPSVYSAALLSRKALPFLSRRSQCLTNTIFSNFLHGIVHRRPVYFIFHSSNSCLSKWILKFCFISLGLYPFTFSKGITLSKWKSMSEKQCFLF